MNTHIKTSPYADNIFLLLDGVEVQNLFFTTIRMIMEKIKKDDGKVKPFFHWFTISKTHFF